MREHDAAGMDRFGIIEMRIKNRGPKLYDTDLMIEEYRKILNSCHLTTGEWNELLEKEFSVYSEVDFGISCSSGGDAFTMILLALKQRRGVKRVFIPSNTHLATINPAMMLGLEIVITDINQDMLMDLPSVVPQLQRNDVLCLVAIGGFLPGDLVDYIGEIETKGATIIIDAAHAHGSCYAGKSVASWGLAASFSFYPSKLVCGGEGGIVLTDDRELGRELMRIRNCGKVCSTYNSFVTMGMSSRLSNVLAMMAITQFRHLEEIIKERRSIAQMYKQAISKNARFIIPKNHNKPNYYKFTIALKDKHEAHELERYMLANGIELSSKVFPCPLHRQPVVKEYLGSTPHCPAADFMAVSHLCLPGYIGITEEEVNFVCERLKKFWES